MSAWLAGGLLAWLVLLASGLRCRYVLVVVRGQSMAPTFTDGQRLLVRRGSARVGDAVVFRPPSARPPVPGDPVWRVKRVAAVGGQPVPVEVRERVGAGPGAVVPTGFLVVRGDAPRSEDSRHFGFVGIHAVLGPVVLAFGHGRASRSPIESRLVAHFRSLYAPHPVISGEKAATGERDDDSQDRNTRTVARGEDRAARGREGAHTARR